MKLKQEYEDFIAKNLKEFYGLYYCETCLELQTTNDECCGHKHFLSFQEFDRETQRKIVSTEFDRYA